jgi:hypothetical protein
LSVDLVHDHDNRDSSLKRLAKNESGLGEGTFRGVNEKDTAIHHHHRPLYLSAEVGVAWSIEDVDLNVAPFNRAVFCGDGDSTLTLKVHAVHHAVSDLLVRAEESALSKEVVNKGRLAVVYVRDDSDVADIGINYFVILSHGARMVAR